MAGTEHFFVISDLHLGGRPPTKENDPHDFGFQMCPPANQQRLAAFIRWIAEMQRVDDIVHLIIAGDIVDFLAEEDSRAVHGYSAFTSKNGVAASKLERVMEHTRDIWLALCELLDAGGRLTMMLGNHDVELALPGPRSVLAKWLGSERVTYVGLRHPTIRMQQLRGLQESQENWPQRPPEPRPT